MKKLFWRGTVVGDVTVPCDAETVDGASENAIVLRGMSRCDFLSIATATEMLFARSQPMEAQKMSTKYSSSDC